MNIRPILLGCGLMLVAAASADDQQAFEAAYKAYGEAVAAQQFHAALEPAAEARRIGESLYAIGRTKPWTGNDDYLPLFKRAPEYPRSAATRDREGFVLLEFTVDEMGFVRKPTVVDSKGGKVFHQPALEAAKGFRYAPRFVDGKAVPVPEVRNRIVFMMHPGG